MRSDAVKKARSRPLTDPCLMRWAIQKKKWNGPWWES